MDCHNSEEHTAAAMPRKPGNGAAGPSHRTIALTGFMGCGKSSVGKELSKIIGGDFIDLDDFIEKREGMTIPEIFSSGGEPLFRSIERESLESILLPPHREKTLTLSLGGGTLMAPGCVGLIKENAFCVYMRARLETLADNLLNDFSGRPMLAGINEEGLPLREALMNRISRLMAVRSSVYEDSADLIIDIDGLDSLRTANFIAGLCR